MFSTYKVLVTAGLVFCLFWPAFGKYSGGTGTETDPYQVSDVNDLLELSADVNDYNDCFLLINDINLAGYGFTTAVIAPDINSDYDFQGTAFDGIFDGNGHMISNLTIDADGSDYIGLFGSLGPGGRIRDLGTEDVFISGYDAVGSLTGENRGNITNCYSTGAVHGYTTVGGLVGKYYYTSIITNCYSMGSVNGNGTVGGLVGGGTGEVVDCYSTGSVNGYSSVGGLAGISYGSIANCYNTGGVAGNCHVGGLVGEAGFGSIVNCYNIADVNGYGNVGGLVGQTVSSIDITGCYSTGAVECYSGVVGGLVGYSEEYANITGCYSTGTVRGIGYIYFIGGLIGKNDGNLANCYSTAAVEGYSSVGGLVGDNWGSVSNCYCAGTVSGIVSSYALGGLVGSGYECNVVTASFWDIDTSGQMASCGGEGKTTAQMQMKNTFTDADWDFADIWNIGENQTYPFLRKYSTGDLNYDGRVDFVDFALFADDWLQVGIY